MLVRRHSRDYVQRVSDGTGCAGVTAGLADEEAARLRAGKIAVACGWPQEVRQFRVPMQLPGVS
jgi:hypothetical protein